MYLSKLMIKPRNLIETFSCFLVLQSTFQSAQWRRDRGLLESMMQKLQANAELDSADPDTKEVWAMYWLQNWRQLPQNSDTSDDQPQAFWHLFAYLQEPALSIAKRTHRRSGSSFKDYEPGDLLSLTLLKVPDILRHFQREKGNPLAAYATASFHKALLNEGRRICSSAGDFRLGFAGAHKCQTFA
ncbi:MAG: hypothetical protein HC810_03710 [Acaryochloridaceae cyanobacterium RL_2_7]|nr:hypothetical protein [Acaryochloridaceae cyanobacterium RL_2_7]